MHKKLVSVIVPVYNVKEYIDECIESVIKQTYKNLEILLIDDGSSDGSSTMCDQWCFKDSRIKVFHKENGGLSSARNYGMKKMSGDYAYFLDSDDYIEKRTIELLIRIFEEKKLDMAIFDGQCFWDEPPKKNIIKNYRNLYKRENHLVTSGPKMFITLKKCRQYYPTVPMHFYSKIFLDSNGLKFEEGILHEDELFSVLAYYYAEKVECCNYVLYWRRMRTASIMNSKISIENVNSCYKILEILINLIEAEDETISKEKRSMIRLGLAHCMWLFYVRLNLLEDFEKKKAMENKKIFEKQLWKHDFYNSNHIFGCYVKKMIIPLRNNDRIRNIYKRLFSHN